MYPDAESFSSKARGKYGEADWEKVRKAFATSIMSETSLHSLAQNLDMPDWPIRGETETPAKYVELPYDQLTAMPGLAGRPERIDQLIAILKETLAFDEPFGDMISASEATTEKDNPILKNLTKLGIPEDYPIPLVALTAETRDLCTRENLNTLKEFALFAQNISQSVIVGGDFRALLNALSHVDESTLSLYLPFRPGSKGVHLLEGLGLTVRAYPTEIQAALAREFGGRLGADDATRAASVAPDQIANASSVLAQQTAAYVEYFQADLAALQQQLNDGVPLGRLATVLNDALVECVVTNLLKPYLTFPASKTPVRSTPPPMEEARSGGFFSSLRRLFKK